MPARRRRRPLLACADLGNSRIHLALFEGARVLRARALDYADLRHSGAREILRRPDLEAVCYSSVVPSKEREFERRLRPSVVLKLGRDLPVPVRVRAGASWSPGTDRLCNALAAFRRFGGACICVDIGTAVNIEVVSNRGELVAGIIAPGPALMLQALRRCESLPEVRSVTLLLGRSTQGNMAGGVGLAVAGLVREAVGRARSLVGRRAPVIATGGGAPLLRGAGYIDRFDPLLTLRGIALAYRHRR